MRHGFFTFAFIISLFLPSAAFAQENGTGSGALAPTPTPSVEYTLAYPGILPDNPLYPLKMLRDRVVLFLITDPVKKAEFTLLQADKRLQAGTFLYRSNPQKVELAIETVSKGEDYFFQALSHARQVEKEGRTDMNILLLKLGNASRKHEEVLVAFEKELPKEYRHHIAEQQKRVSSYQNQVRNLRPGE